jgi:AAA domain
MDTFIPLVQIITEKHANPQTWFDKWKHHPEFAKLVMARSLGVNRREVAAFFESVSKGSQGIHEFKRSRKPFPEIQSLAEMIKRDIPKPPEIVRGIVRKGCKMVVGGPSKARKTWIIMDFAVSIAAGVEWLGFKTERDRVLYVNFELMESSFKDRTLKIAASKGLDVSIIESN